MIMDRAIAKNVLLKHKINLVLNNEEPELIAAIEFAVEDLTNNRNLYHDGFLDGCENMLGIFRQGKNAEIIKKGEDE